MRNHRVLENDIDVNEIFSLAGSAGFTQVKVRAVGDLAISLEKYNALFTIASRAWSCGPPHGDGCTRRC